MKYTTVKIGGIITQVAETTEIKGYTVGVIEIMWPDNTDKWSKKRMNQWIAENNKRMESICNFLNESGDHEIPFGISTRLYLAGMAMQGILAGDSTTLTCTTKSDVIDPHRSYQYDYAKIAKNALTLADKLIQQEEETRQ